MGGEVEQYDVMDPQQMMLYARSVLKYNERNLDLREDLVDVCSNEGLVGMYPKSHNVPHQLGIERFMNI